VNTVTLWLLMVLATSTVAALLLTRGGRHLLLCGFHRLSRPPHQRRYLRPNQVLVEAVHGTQYDQAARAGYTRDALGALIFHLGGQRVDPTVVAAAILACRPRERGVILSIVDGTQYSVDPDHLGAAYLMQISNRVRSAEQVRL
jgi:hypothetical protein